ncbi:MAG: FAD-dependent oxidoreductase [Chthoniobacteraceae bacterium]
MHVDVLVAGGGSAGLAAAVAAARLGARTMLIEQSGSLGGMVPAALVHSICGLYRLPQDDGPARIANIGFAEEFARRLIIAGGASGPVRMGRVDVLLQQPTAFARLADEIARATDHLEVRLHTDLVQVAEDLSSVEVSCRGRREKFTPRAIIDATGDGNLAALAGADFEQESADRLQRPAFIFALGAVEGGAAAEAARLRLTRRIVDAVKEDRLPAGALGAAFRESGRAGEVFVTVDLSAGMRYQPTDAACLTVLEMEGRALADALAGFLRDKVEGFGGSFISAYPARLGVRESRRLVGRARVSETDLLRGAEFADGVALATWPMELRETNTGPRLRYPENGRACEIPLGALRARDHDRLFMAGRCISCSHEAQASIRVIGTCLATGESAGLAAALAIAHGDVDSLAVRAARVHVMQ